MTTAALNEIFNNSTTAKAARLLDGEELPSERINMIQVQLPHGQLSTENWVSLKRDLSRDGLEITATHGRLVYISGYLPRKDYDVQREVKAMMTKYRYSARSRSFSQ